MPFKSLLLPEGLTSVLSHEAPDLSLYEMTPMPAPFSDGISYYKRLLTFRKDLFKQRLILVVDCVSLPWADSENSI